MALNIQGLDDYITSSGKKRNFLAAKCGLSRQGFDNKAKGKTQFTPEQIKVLCDELNITSLKERDKIFFGN